MSKVILYFQNMLYDMLNEFELKGFSTYDTQR